MLDALSLALNLSSFSQIVGFRDPKSGLIIPPSIVCSEPDQIQKNEIYEVMIRQIASQPFQGSVQGGVQSTNQTSSNQNTQLGETQASFNARVGNLQQVIGSVEGISPVEGLTQQTHNLNIRDNSQRENSRHENPVQYQYEPMDAQRFNIQRQTSTAPDRYQMKDNMIELI